MENKFQQFPENRQSYHTEQQNILEREAADITGLEAQLKRENAHLQQKIAKWVSSQDRELQKNTMLLAAQRFNSNLELLSRGTIRIREINQQLTTLKAELIQMQHN